MPVNWAFPAAQGEPESFLAILDPILLLQIVTTVKSLACSGFCNRFIDPHFNVLISDLRARMPSTPLPTGSSIDYFRGRSLTDEIAFLCRSCAGACTHGHLSHR